MFLQLIEAKNTFGACTSIAAMRETSPLHRGTAFSTCACSTAGPGPWQCRLDDVVGCQTHPLKAQTPHSRKSQQKQRNAQLRWQTFGLRCVSSCSEAVLFLTEFVLLRITLAPRWTRSASKSLPHQSNVGRCRVVTKLPIRQRPQQMRMRSFPRRSLVMLISDSVNAVSRIRGSYPVVSSVSYVAPRISLLSQVPVRSGPNRLAHSTASESLLVALSDRSRWFLADISCGQGLVFSGKLLIQTRVFASLASLFREASVKTEMGESEAKRLVVRASVGWSRASWPMLPLHQDLKPGHT